MIIAAPYNQEIEVGVLSAVISYPEIVPIVAKRINSKTFYLEIHGMMFKSILKDYNTHAGKIDMLTVSHAFSELYPEKKNEGIVKISDIMAFNAIDVRDKIEWYLDRMLDYQARRRLLSTGVYIQKHANDLSTDTAELIQKLQSNVDVIKSRSRKESNLTDDIDDATDSLGKRGTVVEFNIPILDRKISGFMRNDITTIGGRTSHGKTTFTIDTAIRQLNLGYKVTLITNEVTKKLYIQKMLCNIADIEYQRVIKYGEITDESKEKLDQASQKMKKEYIGKLKLHEFIDNIYHVTSIIADESPDIFYLDWLQRINLVPGESDDRRIIKTVYGELAKCLPKTNTAGVIVSQLSTRKSQLFSGVHRRPQLFDFDDSSFIEKASCDCHLIYWYYNDTLDKRFMTIAELISAKIRFGEPSVTLLSHNPLSGRYRDSRFISPDRKKEYAEETGMSLI